MIISLAGVSFWESLISDFNYLATYNNEQIAQIAILKMMIPMVNTITVTATLRAI